MGLQHRSNSLQPAVYDNILSLNIVKRELNTLVFGQ